MEQSNQPAFRAKAKYFDNYTKKKKDTEPDWKVYVDFRPQDAMAAAEWLMAMADDCQLNGTTIRQYDSNGNYKEITGFSTGIGMWEQKPREGDKLDEEGRPLYPRFHGWWRPFMPELPQPQPEPETSGESDTPNVTTETCPMPPGQPPQQQPACPVGSSDLVHDDFDTPMTWQTTPTETPTETYEVIKDWLETPKKESAKQPKEIKAVGWC